MSDHSEIWEEMHKEQIETEKRVEQVKERLVSEVPTETMIKIMFADFLDKQSQSRVIELGWKHLSH